MTDILSACHFVGDERTFEAGRERDRSASLDVPSVRVEYAFLNGVDGLARCAVHDFDGRVFEIEVPADVGNVHDAVAVESAAVTNAQTCESPANAVRCGHDLLGQWTVDAIEFFGVDRAREVDARCEANDDAIDEQLDAWACLNYLLHGAPKFINSWKWFADLQIAEITCIP